MATWESRFRLLDLDLFEDDLNGRLREAACAFLKALEEDGKPDPNSDDFTKDAILGCHATYPKTLHEYALEDPEHWWWELNTEKQDRFRDFFSNIRNFAFLGQTRHGIEYHSKLPPADSDFPEGAVQTLHDVWLICKPYSSKVEAFRHWSVLTQGRIIHLTADKRGGTTGLAGQNLSKKVFLTHLLAEGKGMAHVDLKWKDLSSSKYETYQKLRSKPNPTKFVAYNVGRTMYMPWQVRRLAGAIIECMRDNRSYHLFDNNCQHFVISLIRHIVMTQRRDIAIGGTLLEIVDYDQGRPGLELKPWLTRAKRRLLFLTESVSKSKMKSGSTDSLGYVDNKTWAYWVQVGLFKKTWLEVPLQILASEHRIAETRVQYNKHAKERIHSMNRLMQKSSAFLQMVMWTRTWLVRSSWLSASVPWVKYAIPAVGVASSISGAPAILGAGFFLYLFISRTLYARGTAKPVHYDIRRARPSPESPPTSSDNDSDHGHIRPDDDGGGRGDDKFLLLDYTAPGLLEDGFLHAQAMFSPDWIDQPRSTQIPSFSFTSTSGEPMIPRGAMTPDRRNRRGVSIPIRSHSTSPASPLHELPVSRASSPASLLVRPRTASSLPQVRALGPNPARSHSTGRSSAHSVIQRHTSSHLRPWDGREMVFPQPLDPFLGLPSLQAQAPGSLWTGRSPEFLRPTEPRFPRPSLQRQVSAPPRSWNEEFPTLLSPPISAPQGSQRRATSQPPNQNSNAMGFYEGEDSSLLEPPQQRLLPLARQHSESRSGSRHDRLRPWTLSSPRPRRRPRPQHSLSMPTEIRDIEREIDELVLRQIV